MNPFKVLGITPAATQKQVDAAYRALAKQHHPDVNSAEDADANMKRLNEAYEMICQGWQPAPARGLERSDVIAVHYYGYGWGHTIYVDTNIRGEATAGVS